MLGAALSALILRITYIIPSLLKTILRQSFWLMFFTIGAHQIIYLPFPLLFRTRTDFRKKLSFQVLQENQPLNESKHHETKETEYFDNIFIFVFFFIATFSSYTFAFLSTVEVIFSRNCCLSLLHSLMESYIDYYFSVVNKNNSDG